MSTSITSYRDLFAWQKAFALGLTVHKVAGSLPDHERYGLTSQLRRGAVSVASNIAEGYGRGTTVDYLRFLRISRGALFEIDTQLRFAFAFGYITETVFQSAIGELEEAARVLAGLIRSLE